MITDGIDEIYQFAADMGGAGYIFTGEHDADVMHNSAQINLNVADLSVKRNINKTIFDKYNFFIQRTASDEISTTFTLNYLPW